MWGLILVQMQFYTVYLQEIFLSYNYELSASSELTISKWQEWNLYPGWLLLIQ